MVLTQLKKGAFFGELAVMFVALANLMLIFHQLWLRISRCWDVLGGRVVARCCQDMPRTASVRAATAVTALSLTREVRLRVYH